MNNNLLKTSIPCQIHDDGKKKKINNRKFMSFSHSYHKGIYSSYTDLCISISKEKPQKAIKGHNQETENRHSYDLQHQEEITHSTIKIKQHNSIFKVFNASTKSNSHKINETHHVNSLSTLKNKIQDPATYTLSQHLFRCTRNVWSSWFHCLSHRSSNFHRSRIEVISFGFQE